MGRSLDQHPILGPMFARAMQTKTSVVSDPLNLMGRDGPIGLVIVVLIGVVTVLLIMNMNKRIKKLPPSFEEQPPPRPDDAPPAPPKA